MHIRIGMTVGLVAAAFSASLALGQAPGPQGGTNPSCPPSSDGRDLCLRFEPAERLGRTVDPALL